MFLWWGPELVQLYNDAYRPSFGASGRHPHALGMRGRECWTDIWNAIAPQIEQVMSGGEATWHEDQYLPIERNGRLEDVWWTYSYSPVLDDDGSVGGTLVVCQETTRRILAELERERLKDATRDAEQRAARVLERMNDEHLAMDADFRILSVNAAAERALGRTREELRDLTHWEAFPASVGSEVELHYRRVMTDRVDAHFTHHSLGDGYDRYLEIDAYPTDDGGIALFGRDVSAAIAAEREREQLVRALQVERSRLADVFRQAPAFLAVFRGPEHVFELVNDAYYQLVGHRDLLGKPAFEALPEVRDQGFNELLDQVLTTGEPFVGREIPLLVQRAAGAPSEERFIDFVYLSLVEADGTRSGVIAHGTDVTQQVLARREVERLLSESELARAEAEAARAAAVEADEAKSRFLATMSHELRTPLNAIQGHVELLDMGLHGPITDEQRAALGRVDRAQRHLLGLVNDVLNFARLGSGRVEYDVRPTAVAEVLAEVLPMVEPQLRAQGLTLSVDLPGSHGHAHEPPILVLADREKLGQVLLNLLSNAVKFTPRGGRVTVNLATPHSSVEADTVYIRVSDSGIGIPADKLEAVFEPFVQVRTDFARTVGGTGLGLAISRDLVRGMGGDLRVRSTEGRGSTFTVTLRRVPHDTRP